MNGEISLKDLLDTTFSINEKDEMVGSFTIKRINMIGDILTNQYEEIERLNNKIEELREFLLHSSLSIEDMKRVDEILKS